MEEAPEVKRERRTRRRENGMAEVAGIARPPQHDRVMRSMALLKAALRVWEAKHLQSKVRSPWQRRRPADNLPHPAA
ncbi:MAG: hypothetical protein ACJ8HU_03080 [Chthoniobacterales bacterium]